MLSSNARVLKAHIVNIENDNKVLIETAFFDDAVDSEKSDGEWDENTTEEEQAESILINATRKSEAIIKDALDEAEGIVRAAEERAKKEAEVIIETARVMGHKEGIENAQEEAEAIRTQAQAVLERANNERIAAEESLEPDMLDLIVRIVAKLLDVTAAINPQVILNLIKQGLAGATVTGNITVYVSPHDYEIVTNNKEMIMSMADGSIKLDVVKDLSLNPLDCVIETPYGNIDCSLGQQFETLQTNLLYILSNA
jgi:flagellar assembly protein FliH